MLAITETWLDNNIPSNEVEPTGYTLYRADRDLEITGNSRGGRVGLFIQDDWCWRESVVVRESLCTPDIELLCVSLCPYYLPRQFPRFFTGLYVHPQANVDKASEMIFNLSQKLDTLSPDAPFFSG